MHEEMKKYVAEELQAIPPTNCKFKVGDVVTYTNDFGVSFEGNTVIGFSKPDHPLSKYGNSIHLDFDCYWMPIKPESLCLAPTAKVDRDLVLNNGQKAKHNGFDFWSRPIYELASGIKVCCVNLNGSFLHTMSKDGEPISPLTEPYQPVVV